jgi:Ca2+-binding EF-hand superfamily protein
MQSAFETIDAQGDGYLTGNSINRFLKVNGYTATPSELEAIIRRLDADADYRLSFAEFIETFTLREFRDCPSSSLQEEIERTERCRRFE